MEPRLIDRPRDEWNTIGQVPLSFSLVIALAFLLAILIAGWWHGEKLERYKGLAAHYKDASSLSELPPGRAKALKETWGKSEKNLISGKVFRNEKIPRDGFGYVGCEFYNVMFVFNGDTPFDLINNKISGATIETRSPAVAGMFKLIEALGMLKADIPVTEFNK